ncbi:acyltransferase domain-containing protein, partial [Streptomyces sp. t39]|uniref:acyltransferase domain-containing protein n=1 Tax=Streptomyces sp. t39 TaxID=1828156 RepID=UPI0011CDB704
LEALASGEPAAHVITGTADVDGRTVFVFPGQGHQWTGMGARLLDTSPVFHHHIGECAVALRAYVDWDLVDVLRGTEGAPGFDRVDVVQPASFAVMVALARLWQHHGITPHAVTGHSQGEIAAAHIAGTLTLDDAARIVTLRSQAIATHLAGHGGMMSLPLPLTTVENHLTDHPGIEIAAVNGPNSTVVAGDPTALDTLHTHLNDNGIRARKIPVDYASHTTHVTAIENELATLLDGITPRTADIPLHSTLTGELIDGTTMTADHWYQNLRHQVRFATTIENLARTGHRTFIEISAHPVLTMPIGDILDQHADTPWTTTGAPAESAAATAIVSSPRGVIRTRNC